MKLLFFICLFIVCADCSFAQSDSMPPASCLTPKTCTNNLNYPIFNVIGDEDRCYAQACRVTTPPMPTDYHDVTYTGKHNNGITKDCPLPTANNCTNDISGLRYHIYYPTDITYGPNCKLPVVIYFHGGSFEDCNGNYMSQPIVAICQDFAKRGFIAITVEYRLGVELTLAGYTPQQMLAIWRAGQDARGAIRSIIKHERDGDEPFRIDISKIFIAGNSAGSVVAMNVAYYQPALLVNAYPSNISDPNILGGINQDFYYGDVSTTFTIRGVLDMWGGVLIPKNTSTADYLSNPELFFYQGGNTLPPTIAFCGKNDMTFNYTSEPLKFYDGGGSIQTLSENYCLTKYPLTPATYTVSTNDNAYGSVLGSQNIYEMLRRQHVYTEFYLDCQMGHGLDKDCLCPPNMTKDINGVCNMPCTFQSEFGTGLTNSTQVNTYIVKRAATFFQGVLNGAIYNSYPTTKFVECANDRNSCKNNSSTSCIPDSDFTYQVCP